MNPLRLVKHSSDRNVVRTMYSAVSMAFVSTILVAAAVGTVSVSELPSLGGAVSGYALGINDRGDVVGRSYTADYAQTSTLWALGGAPSALSSLAGATASEAVAISSTGAIVGTSTVDYAFVATLWPSATAAAVPLVGLGGMNTQVTATNTRGDMVGHGLVADNSVVHAILWSAGNRNGVDLGTLSGGSYSQAFGINAAGDAVGVSDDASWSSQAVLWSATNRAPVVLKSLGGRNSRALGINDAGDIVGESQTALGSIHATLWPAAGRLPVDLGVLSGGNFSGAAGINAAGDIVGFSGIPGDLRHAVVWPAGSASGTPAPSTCGKSNSRSENNSRSEKEKKRRGKGPPTPLAGTFAAARPLPVDLGTLPGGSTSQALAINASGQIVGYGSNGTEDRSMSWSWTSSVVVPPTGTPPGHGQQGNHQNEGEEEGDC